MALCLVLSLFAAASAWASHFRYGVLSWEPTGTPGEVKFSLTLAVRRDDVSYLGSHADGFAQTGDIITEDVGSTSLLFGDVSETGILQFRVTAFSQGENWLIGEALNPGTTDAGILHTYAGPGQYVAEIFSSARISGLNNRAAGQYRLQTIVDPFAGNRSPISTMVPVANIPESPSATFTVPGSDPDGDSIRFRLSTEEEATGDLILAHPPGLSIDPNTGVVTWDNTGLDQVNFWTTQVVIEDLDGSGNVKTKIPVDFMMRIVAQVGNPPVCEVNPPGPFVVTPGQPISFTVTGTDPDGDILELNTGGLPGGAMMTPGLPISGPSGINSTFNWTPQPGDAGSYVVIFSVTDDDGNQSLCSASIRVDQGPPPPRLYAPEKINFGGVYLGQRVPYDFYVTNVSDVPVTISGFSAPQGDHSSFFDVFVEVSLPHTLQPNESLLFHTTFRPEEEILYNSFFDIFTDDLAHPAMRVNLCGQGVIPPTMLHFTEAFARPGGNAIVDLILDSPGQHVAGIQFKLQPYCGPDPTWYARLIGVVNDLPPDYTVVFSTDPNTNISTVLVFSTSGAPIPGDHHRIIELVFAIDPGTPFGKWIDLVTWDVIVSDPNSQPIPFQLWQGKIHIGIPGDDDLDGRHTVLDIIKEIKIILGRLPSPQEPFDFFLADANGDGWIDVRDIVWKVNVILYWDGIPPMGGPPTKVIADGPTSPVTVSLGTVQTLAGTQLAVPVTLQANGAIAGLQATFTFDAAHLQLGTPQLVGAAAGMTLQSQVVDGKLQVIIYSATGQVIPAGSGTTLLIPATLLGEGAPELRLADVLLADRGAQAIPAVVGTGTVKVAPLPTAFALKGARPNPFNPTTRLAYEVPKAAHIVLAVYNLLGQEVIRLVDAEQQPGRYEVVWNGRNAQGLSVASGVYLYRLTSSTGFSETKRMTLLK
ncbi:MAG: T9SS type A sorting domain-containing protein [Candidatus Latescibacteria bacterium]|nr:T9SS type A sorting domain-containing protein [Candidatus Latescibacterota bacterium]